MAGEGEGEITLVGKVEFRIFIILNKIAERVDDAVVDFSADDGGTVAEGLNALTLLFGESALGRKIEVRIKIIVVELSVGEEGFEGVEPRYFGG